MNCDHEKSLTPFTDQIQKDSYLYNGEITKQKFTQNFWKILGWWFRDHPLFLFCFVLLLSFSLSLSFRIEVTKKKT